MRPAHAAWHLHALLTFGLLVASASTLPAANPLPTDGTLPTAADGRRLNLDFETGTLADWTATGDAFAKQPIEGDTVAVRKRGTSAHQGKFWLGGYERVLDKPTGTLTSAPFRASQPWAGLRIGGGHRETRVEVVRRDNSEIIWSGSGRNIENLEPVAIDLRAHQGKELFVRIVDEHTGHWGHINFDDFRLYASKPNFPDREPARSISGGQPVAAKGQAPSIPPDDLFKHNGLSPEAAAKAMTLPEGFQATLFAGEPDVQQPIAMALDDRGRLWVAEAYSYPIKVKPEEARDRVLIFEDADGDGRFDSRKVFIDKLNLVSGLELGFGGVYIGAAPELLFVPDADGDDRPDGPPQVLLDGWGSQDTHETLNSFIWGPDGWLYGCHGVFTHSRVGKPGTPDDKRTPLNAGIWRYHPVRHEFEVFAQGTSNPWGVDFNDRGEAFLTACVIPHLFHVIQNGRYHRQAGSHFNPYTYEDIKTIAKHRHWIGATPHAGNNKSDSGGGGHAHSGAMIYLGGKWPAKYRDQIFMNNIHGARLNQDQLAPQGSGYVGDRAPDFLLSNDSWSQILYFTYGPDGDMWMIDWYDRQQCHRREIDVHDRSNGRIFRVTYGKPTPTKVDLKKLSDLELAEQVLNPNDWYVRHARRILQERAAKNGAIELNAQRRLVEVMTTHSDDTRRLRALWAWHVTVGFREDILVNLLQSDPSEHVKGWCIRLACDGPSPALTEQQISNAVYPLKSPVVRRYIASVLPKFHHSDRFQFLLYLLKQADDAGDHNLPLLYWYAAESIVEHNPYLAATLLFTCRIDSVRAFLVRRLAQQGDPEVFELILGNLPTEEPLLRLTLRELTAGLQGARRVAAPPSWGKAYTALTNAEDGEVRELADGLGLTFGDAGAVDKLTRVALDGAAPLERRQAALTALLKARVENFIPQLKVLLDDKTMRGAALRGMAAYDDPAVPQTVLGIYASLTPAEKRDALGTLSARVAYGQALLDAVAAGTVPRADLSADLIRQLRNLKDPALEKRIVEVWGNVNDTPEERLRLIREYQRLVTAPHPKPADKHLGRAVFAKACAQCHTLFGTGGKIGPELTGSNRANLDYLLSNILDPSALIGRDYIPHVLETSDGRVLTGLVRDETPTSLTLVTATETLIVPKNEIDSREASKKSMMPEDILKPLSDDEVRGLFAYLATPTQVPMAATVENAKSLFNGRDLTGWTGNRELWSVENGELVGRTTSGLAKNEFLVSDLAAGDFRLTLEVKLVENRGNSGVQFRSITETSGSVRGYQADVGPGWWGKLYEEHGRGLLWTESGEKHLRSGEWNTYEITAVGSRVQTKLNGRTCVDLADPAGMRSGVFALQLHSGGPTEVRYRNLRLELNPKWDFSLAPTAASAESPK